MRMTLLHSLFVSANVLNDASSHIVYLFILFYIWKLLCTSGICLFVLTDLSGGLVGLSLNYVISLMALFQWAVRQSTEVESLVSFVFKLCLF